MIKKSFTCTCFIKTLFEQFYSVYSRRSLKDLIIHIEIMSTEPTRILIRGHSFVANLKSYIRRNLSADVNYTLGLHPRDVMI